MIEQITLDDIVDGFGSTTYVVGDWGVKSIRFVKADERNNPYSHDFFFVKRTGKPSVHVPYEKVLLIFPSE